MIESPKYGNDCIDSRISIYPDGGLSRVRLFGKLA